MKKIVYILIITLTFSCTKNDGFTLFGKINGNYSDYIYLNYNSKVDSVLVVNNTFEFKGKIKNTYSRFS
ncbi:MAG: DUF4369 domain-containing protein [Polaribacter sp.]|nr:DUF4369 domain-containing protein [Polaribacter sp.]MDG1812347.1 DUF4369 domain-containing protein [Polaribacter sp.]MDG1993170.1 DUF4369 domain-containing protein [Polaribacter sp.]